MRFDRRIYGPGVIKGARTLLATPHVDYSEAEAAAILAASKGRPFKPAVDDDLPSGAVDVDVVPQPDPDAGSITPPAPVDPPEVKHVGGGWYELPNGERIRGRDAAEAAAAQLTS